MSESKEPVRHNSIIERERDHFAGLAETWWDPAGPFWPLHRLNEVRIGWILKQVAQHGLGKPESATPLQGITVLDIGCGGGILSESLARAGARVCAIDVVDRNIEIARAHAEQSGLQIDYALQPVEELVETGAQYDIVFNMEVVEHVDHFPTFMRHCQALVKPDGLTFIATINRNPVSWLIAIIGAEYVLRWLPMGTHHYRQLRKPAEVARCLRADGFRCLAQTGVAVNPFTRQLSLIRSMCVNYMLCAQRSSFNASADNCARNVSEDEEFV